MHVRTGAIGGAVYTHRDPTVSPVESKRGEVACEVRCPAEGRVACWPAGRLWPTTLQPATRTYCTARKP